MQKIRGADVQIFHRVGLIFLWVFVKGENKNITKITKNL